MKYSADNLLLRSTNEDKPGLFARLSAEQAGWDYLNLVAMRLEKGKTFGITIAQYEYLAVILSGVCDIRTNKGNFEQVGYRRDVFSGLPFAIYMPRNTEFEIEAKSDNFEVISCWSPTDRDTPIKLITPDDVKINMVGGGTGSYQVNALLPNDFGSHRLLAQEVYTPGGNWSNYPPFKHDDHRTTGKGDLLEANLEKVCFYKQQRPGGYAIQRIYSEDDSLSATVIPQNNDVVIVPKGYHPLACPPGYPAYTLQVMAGSAHQVMTKTDPIDAWMQDTPAPRDARLPLVDRGMHPREG